MVRVRVYPSQLSGRVEAPPSKSYTHRALTLALLAEGTSIIENPLIARDTQATLLAVKAFGSMVVSHTDRLEVEGVQDPRLPENIIDVLNSGTTIRFMTAIAGLAPKGYTILTGDESIRRRPMQPLLDALAPLGVRAWSARGDGCPPVIVAGGGWKGGTTRIRGDISSQFISGLILASTRGPGEVEILVEGPLVSRPYIDATLKMVNTFGGKVHAGNGWFRVPGDQPLKATRFRVPGDISSATFLLAGAVLTGGRVEVAGLDPHLPQADAAFINYLEQLGAPLAKRSKSVKVEPASLLRAGRFDLSDSPDLLPVMAVLGLKARGGIELRGVLHARFKETDRIRALAEELPKLGARVAEFDDGLRVEGGALTPRGVLDARGDHRLFMAFTIAALATGQVCEVEGLESVDVSYPGFLEDLKALGAQVEVVSGDR